MDVYLSNYSVLKNYFDELPWTGQAVLAFLLKTTFMLWLKVVLPLV